jgi:hypothetical protein
MLPSVCATDHTTGLQQQAVQQSRRAVTPQQLLEQRMAAITALLEDVDTFAVARPALPSDASAC